MNFFILWWIKVYQSVKFSVESSISHNRTCLFIIGHLLTEYGIINVEAVTQSITTGYASRKMIGKITVQKVKVVTFCPKQ